MIPGEVLTTKEDIALNVGAHGVSLKVVNMGDRPIQVGSHYHFYETNAALEFDRKAAYGHRLDCAAGTAVRFEPGQARTVHLIPYRGDGIVHGFRALVAGSLKKENK